MEAILCLVSVTCRIGLSLPDQDWVEGQKMPLGWAVTQEDCLAICLEKGKRVESEGNQKLWRTWPSTVPKEDSVHKFCILQKSIRKLEQRHQGHCWRYFPATTGINPWLWTPSLSIRQETLTRASLMHLGISPYLSLWCIFVYFFFLLWLMKLRIQSLAASF